MVALVNAAGCEGLHLLSTVIWIYTILMLVYAVLSWIPDLRGRWSDYLALVIEPVLLPVRRIIPPVGGFDIAFLVVIILLNVLNRALQAEAIRACYF